MTDFSITEEAFDPALNPIRAKVSLGMRVLSIDDLYFTDKGGSLYMVYQRQKETLAQLYQFGTLARSGSGVSHERSASGTARSRLVRRDLAAEQPVPAYSRYYGIDTATLSTAWHNDHLLDASLFAFAR